MRIPAGLWQPNLESAKEGGRAIGISFGPTTVGPTKAAPTVIGPAVIYDKSFSLKNTPGDISASAICYVYFLIINIYCTR